MKQTVKQTLPPPKRYTAHETVRVKRSTYRASWYRISQPPETIMFRSSSGVVMSQVTSGMFWARSNIVSQQIQLAPQASHHDKNKTTYIACSEQVRNLRVHGSRHETSGVSRLVDRRHAEVTLDLRRKRQEHLRLALNVHD